MEKQIVFKTSIGGFDKKAVLDYIYALNQRAEESQARLNDQLFAATQAKEQLEQDLQAAQSSLADTQSALEQKELRSAAEIQELQKTLEEKTSEIWDLSQVNAENTQKNRDLEGKKAEVEKASAQIGRLLIDAHAEADRITGTAKEEADGILEEARQEAGNIVGDAQAQADAQAEEAAQTQKEMMANAKQAVAEAYGRFSDFQAEVAGIQQVMLGALEDIRAKSEIISDALASAQQAVFPSDEEEAEEAVTCDNAALSEAMFGLGFGESAEEARQNAEAADGESFFR